MTFLLSCVVIKLELLIKSLHDLHAHINRTRVFAGSLTRMSVKISFLQNVVDAISRRENHKKNKLENLESKEALK